MESLPEAILNLLRCPISGGSIRMATDEEKQASERLSGRKCDHGLVSGDGMHFYPVQDGIPLLIPEAAIDLSDRKSALAMEKGAANLRHSAR